MYVLAQSGVDHGLGGWWLGVGIGVAVVVIVALVALALIYLARKIEGQAGNAIKALDKATMNTDPLWALGTTNATALAVLEGAIRAREAVEDL